MENKLQELTDKLYKEGLSKGKAEGEALLAQAGEKAAAMIEDARKQAQTIIQEAQKQAEDYKTKMEGDVKMASMQSIQATKKDIENLMVSFLTDKKIEESLCDASFVKEIIKTVAEKFNAEEAVDLQAVLPESLKAEMVPYIENELSKALKGGITVSFSKKIAGGFNIGPKDGSYFVSLTDETFKNLIGEYLRPATRKILFGE